MAAARVVTLSPTETKSPSLETELDKGDNDVGAAEKVAIQRDGQGQSGNMDVNGVKSAIRDENDKSSNAKTDDGNSKTPSSVKFRVEYVGPTGSVVHQFETKTFNPQDELANATVFEVVTSYRTDKTEGDHANDFKFSTTTAPEYRMHILSGAVIHALRSVVQYYPGQDLSSDIVKIYWPYTILVHHYDELLEYRETIRQTPADEYCYREKDAYEHIGILIEFLDEHIMPAVNEEKARIQRGFCTFDMLWVSLKPGTTIQGRWTIDDESFAGKVHSFSGGTFTTPSTTWNVSYWALIYNGDFVGRQLRDVHYNKFDGEREVFCEPLEIDVRPRKENVQSLVTQGEVYWKLLRKQCMYYKGKTESFPHNEVDGLVMVDMDAFHEQHPHTIPMLMGSTQDTRKWISDCTCAVCNRRRRENTHAQEQKDSTWEDYEDIPPKITDELDDDKYLLLPRYIHGYIFRTRTWEKLHVNGFSQPVFEEDMIENLVMDKARVGTLKALAKGFIRENAHGETSEREPWSADFVKGKGNGLNFLLHGNPGVGKTCTAECIAAFTSRPLMVLTSSDIGTNPNEIEENLTKHFKRARSWGAVLLIDEADVFMERRSTADLTRNSLVAGFLRALEFYDGILFLTTNRVGAFDDAFMSRIHVKLYYPNFDDESRRKVWKTFIDKLQKERGDYIRLNIDAKEYLEGKELKSVQWNGREIRNAFQTAVALAEFEAEKDQEGKIILTDRHLKAVVEMSRDFKSYLDELHQGDEGKRAERRHERLNK